MSPLRPVSSQLIGDAAAARLGTTGRIAQILDLSRSLPVQLELSSGATPAADDPRTLVVAPPFRFNACVGDAKYTIVEAGAKIIAVLNTNS